MATISTPRTDTTAATPDGLAAVGGPAETSEPSLLQREWKKLLLGLAVFVLAFTMPLGWQRFD